MEIPLQNVGESIIGGLSLLIERAAGRLQEGVYERRVIIPKCGRFRHRPGRKAMR